MFTHATKYLSTFGLVILATVFAYLITQDPLMAQATTAIIQGTVTDATGATVPDAEVRVTNTATSAIQTLTTDAQGRYKAPDLPIGDYEVQASKAGFQTVVRKGITLSVGATGVVDISLPVGQQQQTVTVEGQVSQVETTSSTVSSLVDQTQMRELPLNGRNVEQLILLAPGVQQYTGQSLSSWWGKAYTYSVSGSRPEGQALLLDGQDTLNFWGHGTGATVSGTSLGIDAIAEFQMLTNAYSAQYAGAGAVMNSVSKSGTNSFHGSGFEFIRNSAMDARNFFDKATVPPFKRNQFGGSIGGPIKKDKAFFFVNYEGLRQGLSETKVANVPDANAHNGLLPCATAGSSYVCNPATNLANVGVVPSVVPVMAVFPIPTAELSGGLGTIVENALQVTNENYVLARFDYNLTTKDSFFVRYFSDRANVAEPIAGSLPYWAELDINHNQFPTMEWRRIISPTIVNAARFFVSRPYQNGTQIGEVPGFQFFPADQRVNGSISVPGLSSNGPGGTIPYNFAQTKWGEADDVIWTHDKHSIRVGIEILRDDANTYNVYQPGGSWTFNSMTNFLLGVPTILTGTPLSQSYGNRDIRETDISPYVHDEWKVTSKLTLNIGVRYAFQSNPTDAHNQIWEIVNPPQSPAGCVDAIPATCFTHVSHVFQSGNPAALNFEPRVGVAWDPFADHKTSIRVGFGLFHDLIEVHSYAPSAWSSVPSSEAQQQNPTFPIPFSSVTAVPLKDSPAFDYRVGATPYVEQWNLTVQREVLANTILSVGYNGSHGVHLFDVVNENPAVPTVDSSGVLHFGNLVNGKIVGNTYINPLYGVLSGDLADGWSFYQGMTVGLNRRFTTNAQAQVSYTYSHCEDIGSNFVGAEGGNGGGNQDPFNQRLDKGLCTFDIRQALRINGLYMLPFRGNNQFVKGWQISGIFTVSTGPPNSPADGFDQVGNSSTSRPNVVPCSQVVLGLPTEYYNPACFALQAPGTLGDSGRTNLPGPGLVNTDFSLLKDTRIPRISEAFDVQFRAEFFNIFNHANFQYPSASVFSQGANDTALPNPAFGQITSTIGTSRQIQFGVKILF